MKSKSFWKYVIINPYNECWGWSGSIFPDGGYGQCWSSEHKRQIPASRASWMIHNGPIPKGLWVLHKCDNPICSNPKHLYLGTHSENVLDAKNRNRVRFGERHHSHVMTDEDVVAARKVYETGIGCPTLAKLYGIGKESMRKIIRRKAWRRVA